MRGLAIVRTLVLVWLVAALPSVAVAQMKVFVNATAEDMVGGRLAYAIKEGIRRSAGMELVDRVQDAIIRVNIVTLDPDRSEGGGNRTIYSLVFTTQTFHDTPVTMYLNNVVGICGSSRVGQCAEGLVADTDQEASKVRGWIQTMVERERTRR